MDITQAFYFGRSLVDYLYEESRGRSPPWSQLEGQLKEFAREIYGRRDGFSEELFRDARIIATITSAGVGLCTKPWEAIYVIYKDLCRLGDG